MTGNYSVSELLDIADGHLHEARELERGVFTDSAEKIATHTCIAHAATELAKARMMWEGYE